LAIGVGEIAFADQNLTVNESDGSVDVKICRAGSANSEACVTIETYDISATNKVDYVGFKSRLS
jgi:hypothetical protein